MRINFIRHGLTYGNTLKKYIGKTDEPLCETGKKQLSDKIFPQCDIIAVSPMKRCIETAQLIYPDKEYIVYEDLRECDFGDFENKNYIELSQNTDYRKWIDSNASLPFPNGEDISHFKRRCINCFLKLISEHHDSRHISLIVHGGTIMSILEKFAVPPKNYYGFSLKNGECYVTDFNKQQIKILEKL